MQFTLNRRSTVPMYRQLAAELREQIVSGAMAEGYRLPVSYTHLTLPTN